MYSVNDQSHAAVKKTVKVHLLCPQGHHFDIILIEQRHLGHLGFVSYDVTIVTHI